MIKHVLSLLGVFFALGQNPLLAADNTFNLVFAIKMDSAQSVRSVYSYAASGHPYVTQVQLPFPLTLKRNAYWIERTYPVEVFRNPSLKAKFEQRLGGRLFAAKVKVNAPYTPESVYQEIGRELARPEVLFIQRNVTVGIPDNNKIEQISVSSIKKPARSAEIDGPSDPLYQAGYNLRMIQADLAQRLTLGSRLPIVALVDTGTDLSHEDLEGNGFINTDEIPGNGIDDDQNGVIDDYDKGFSVTDGKIDNNGVDVQGHGTATASIIGARVNGIGLVGVAPECRILPIRFLNQYGYGNFEDGLIAIGLAIETIVAKSSSRPFRGWINNSWAGFYTDKFALASKILFDLAYENGIGISCAAGNLFMNNDQERLLPATIDSPSNIAVGASDAQDNLTAYGHIGPETVHHAAPGDDIFIALPPIASYTEKYGKGSGTSLAAPHDAGAAILISGIFPDATVDEIVARIVLNSDQTPAFYKAFIIPGRLNVFKALDEDFVPPSNISWASPLTVYHNQADFAWENSADDFNYPRGALAKAVRLEIYTANQEKAVTKLISIEKKGFQKTRLRNLKENTRYFPVLYSIDNVGNTSRPLALASFLTPASQVIFEEDFEKKAWQRVPENSINLWYHTTERFSPLSSANGTKAYRFGRAGSPHYLTRNASEAGEGHILSPPINLLGFGGLELEMDWFLAGDFVFDFLYVIARAELEDAVLASTRNTPDSSFFPAWRSLSGMAIPELPYNTFRLDIFFTTNRNRINNQTEGAYVDNIKIRASRPLVVFPDPTMEE